MPRVEMTSHLYRFFPSLNQPSLDVSGGNVASVLQSIDAIAPGFSDYILDEHGELRRHVNICIDRQIIVDRKALSESVKEDSTLYIFQALTGG